MCDMWDIFHVSPTDNNPEPKTQKEQVISWKQIEKEADIFVFNQMVKSDTSSEIVWCTDLRC